MPVPGEGSGSFGFRDREGELRQVLAYLSQGGEPLLFLGMPAIGKSCLLRRLQRMLHERITLAHFWDTGPGPVHLAELRYVAARASLPGLLATLFPERDWFHTPNIDRHTIPHLLAELISNSGRSRLLLLDGIERLSEPVARSLRRLLCETNQQLAATGALRLALVATSRAEVRAFQGIAAAPVFRKLSLRHFAQEVVAEAVQGEVQRLGLTEAVAAKQLQTVTHALWQVTQGVPALVERALLWLAERWTATARLEGMFQQLEHRLWQAVTSPFLDGVLLRAEALLPAEVLAQYPQAHWGLLANACAALACAASATRLVTRTHLKMLVEKRPEVAEAQRWTAAGPFNLYQLFGQLTVVTPGEELWREMHGAARRLFFLRGYATVSAQISAHREAKDLYARWQRELSPSPYDLSQFTLEHFWHAAEAARLEQAPTQVKSLRLNSLYDDLWWSMDEHAQALFRERVSADDELRQSILAVDTHLWGELIAK